MLKLLTAVLFLAFVKHATGQAPIAGFRPPAVPLIVMDPYMHIWSMQDTLYEQWPEYWTGKFIGLDGMIRVDGDIYQFMGGNSDGQTEDLPKVVQTSVTVWPTRTIYQFHDPLDRVQLRVQFTTPRLPYDFTYMSWPVTYLTLSVSSSDGQQHSVQLYYDNTAEIAVNTIDQEVTWTRFEMGAEPGDTASTSVMQMGTVSQDYFDVVGDAVGIDWGYQYVAVERDESVATAMAGSATRIQFVESGTLPEDDTNKPRACNDDWPVLAVAWDFTVDAGEEVSKYLLFAYDDHYSVEFFGQMFQPLWRKLYGSVESLLAAAISSYKEDLLQECEQFDSQLVQDLEAKGGPEYATLAALAYRQTYASTKMVWNDQLQVPWVFLKEISSNGDMSTVDVIAPASPLLLHGHPEYLLRLLLPIFAYSNNETGDAVYNYTLAWAPHHLGTYPVANIMPPQQENMPMEETGNLLMMLTAIAQRLGSQSNALWYPHYWPLLTGWADYLVASLPDPESQLCTDDFEGATPHNANLAVKGIVGLAAFAELAKLVGQDDAGAYYADQAAGFAAQWLTLAAEGDHYKRQYDLNGTWSLKYNLMYERALNLSVFPADLVPGEMDYYLANQVREYGLLLDDRNNYAKTDWTAWVAAMTADPDQREEIFQLLYTWADTTTSRTPLSDWYDAVTGEVVGFIGRAAVGALYAPMIV